ncbi:MAG: hypothetical protein K940chlam5_00830 [Candidatus Anoxychlamydiales bacterium]|nr:hypothetical protein [Candidatus Anoxychlamydiales bacterium]
MINNIISNISSRMPTDIMLGSISGGMFLREILINKLSIDTKEEDDNVTVAWKSAAGFAIRATSAGLSSYNISNLSYMAAFTNPVLAIHKGVQTIELLRQGDKKEAGKKALEVAAHVAVTAVDYWTLGFSSMFFDIGTAVYTLAGAAMDISKTSRNMHDRLFQSKQEILDRGRLRAEGYDDDYDESSAESTGDDMSSGELDSDYRSYSEEEDGESPVLRRAASSRRATSTTALSSSASAPRRVTSIASTALASTASRASQATSAVLGRLSRRAPSPCDNDYVGGDGGYSSSAGEDESDSPLSASGSSRPSFSSSEDYEDDEGVSFIPPPARGGNGGGGRGRGSKRRVSGSAPAQIGEREVAFAEQTLRGLSLPAAGSQPRPIGLRSAPRRKSPWTPS